MTKAKKPRNSTSPTPPPKASPRASQGFFTAEDGTVLYYEVEGTGKPLVFCYGLTCRREHWHYQTEHFSKRYQIIKFDYRGHHASGRPANDRHLTLEWCGRDIKSLLDHLKVEEAVCFGHSMGVPVICEGIKQASSKIKGAVFICGAVHDPFSYMFYTDRLKHLFQASVRLHEVAPAAFALLWKRFTHTSGLGFFLTSRFGFNPSKAQEQDVVMYMEGVNRTPADVFLSLLSDYVKYDGRGDLKNIQCPVLVIAGSRDCITPFEVQEEMARLLPKGELEPVPYGSHNAHMDYPERVNYRIEEFLREMKYV